MICFVSILQLKMSAVIHVGFVKEKQVVNVNSQGFFNIHFNGSRLLLF